MCPFPQRRPEKLTESAADAILRIASPRRLHRGETLLRAGASSATFWLVNRGRLKMCRLTPAGRNLILALVGPGEAIGVNTALADRPAPATWIALEACDLLAVRRADLYALLAERPDLLPTLLSWMTGHLSECGNCLVESSCARVENRYAALFVELARKAGGDGEEGEERRIPLRLSRQELADLTGTTLETAIRVMTRWGREGVVATTGDGFVVRDEARLQALALG